MTATHTYLGRGLKSRVHSNLWHVPVVDVLVAVPHTVDQVSLEAITKSYTYTCTLAVFYACKYKNLFTSTARQHSLTCWLVVWYTEDIIWIKSWQAVWLLYLQNDQEGEEDQHKEEEAAWVQRQKIILIWEIWLRSRKKKEQTIEVVQSEFNSHSKDRNLCCDRWMVLICRQIE